MFETIQFPTRVASLHASLTDVNRDDFPHVARSNPKSRVSKSRVDINAHTCVVCISPHRFVERDEVAATRASNCPDPNAHHHRVGIASTRWMRAFVHSSSRVNNVFARRPRARDRSTNGCFLFFSTSRRTHRDGLASATRARRDDASMNRIVAIARRPTARSMPMQIIIAMHDGMNERRDRHTRALR